MSTPLTARTWPGHEQPGCWCPFCGEVHDYVRDVYGLPICVCPYVPSDDWYLYAAVDDGECV